jgi:hypothetical protein
MRVRYQSVAIAVVTAVTANRPRVRCARKRIHHAPVRAWSHIGAHYGSTPRPQRGCKARADRNIHGRIPNPAA